MEANIYLDVFFLLNFIMNVCVVYSCGVILRCCRKYRFIIYSSAFGSGMACILLFLQITTNVGLFSAAWIRFFAAGIMARIAYGKKNGKNIFMETICLYFMAFALEGIFRFVHSMWGIFLIIVLSHMIGREQKRRQNQMEVRLFFKGKGVTLTGFYDTGNHLAEPITGRMAHIASYDSVKEILPEPYQKVAESYFRTGLLESTKVTKSQMYEFTFLSYHSIGKETGELLGIRMDSAVFCSYAGKKTEEKAVIALTNQKKLMRDHCQIIINGRLEL